MGEELPASRVLVEVLEEGPVKLIAVFVQVASSRRHPKRNQRTMGGAQ